MQNTRRAFTLIELLVVIAVIGIIASVVLANMENVRGRGRDTQRISDISEVRLALARYYAACKKYPTPDASVTPNRLPALTTTEATCPTGVTLGTFLDALPVAPSHPDFATHYYYYDTDALKVTYRFGTQLEGAIPQNDMDDVFYNMTCVDPVYCVRP